MPLSEVRPGMVCTASSVVSGLEPVDFDATVLSVMGAKPADAMIVMRFGGAAVADGGIGQGFSGSPVRCPDGTGTQRIIGAIAYGIGQYDNTIAGVTPIEAMLSMPTWGSAPTIPVIGSAPALQSPGKTATKGAAKKVSNKKASGKAASSTSARQVTGKPSSLPPLLLSGVRGPLAQRFVAAAAKAGRTLAIAPPAARKASVAASGLKPGDAVASTSVTGDIGASAIGTVSYVDGARVWAFGHPYAGAGATRALMERAEVTAMISSPQIGDQGTFKLGNAVAAIGTWGFDGSFGIAGQLGATPPTIPLSATVRTSSGAVLQSLSASLVDEREVRGGTSQALLPMAAGALAGSAVQLTGRSDTVAGAARTCTTITLRGESVPLFQCRDAVVPPSELAGAGVETGAADSVIAALAPALSAERFARLIDGVHVQVTLRGQSDRVQVRRVRVIGKLRAGKTARLRVTVVQGSTGETREIPAQIHIPRAAAGRRAGLVVYAQAQQADDESIFDLFADEAEAAAPRNLPRLRALYTKAGISGIRAAVIPGMRGKAARELLVDGGDEALSRKEKETIQRRVKLVSELPSVIGTGAVSLTLQVPRR